MWGGFKIRTSVIHLGGLESLGVVRASYNPVGRLEEKKPPSNKETKETFMVQHSVDVGEDSVLLGR